jgi:hypothetical protein
MSEFLGSSTSASSRFERGEENELSYEEERLLMSLLEEFSSENSFTIDDVNDSLADLTSESSGKFKESDLAKFIDLGYVEKIGQEEYALTDAALNKDIDEDARRETQKTMDHMLN